MFKDKTDITILALLGSWKSSFEGTFSLFAMLKPWITHKHAQNIHLKKHSTEWEHDNYFEVLAPLLAPVLGAVSSSVFDLACLTGKWHSSLKPKVHIFGGFVQYISNLWQGALHSTIKTKELGD